MYSVFLSFLSTTKQLQLDRAHPKDPSPETGDINVRTKRGPVKTFNNTQWKGSHSVWSQLISRLKVQNKGALKRNPSVKMRRRALQLLSPNEAPMELLLVFLLGLQFLAACPAACSCNRSHRDVDCSRRALRELPDGLRIDLRSLNMSHNRLLNLDGTLASYTHLRVLDVSHNHLRRVPDRLPRSLWQLHAASNRILRLDKNDTVHQWNLRVLDLSNNNLERIVFINNTLINLCMLNLSYNNLWTFPTNMPARLEIIDISHNSLVKVLPGSLDRLPNLSLFYLHANRLSELPFGVFEQIPSLRVLTLGNNPWACHKEAAVTYLLSWLQRSVALILGCPCRPQPICGGGKTGWWNLSTFHPPAVMASTRGLLPDSTKATTTIDSLPDASADSTQDTRVMTKTPTRITDKFLTTIRVKKASGLRTESVKRKVPPFSGGVDNMAQSLAKYSSTFLLFSLGLLSLMLP
ncbi:oligodendrocyte-myelin glycoprotein [Syngnathus scovelli]|uniref:oligodendrocyte-myelin glycoprotein n=1 Tax=Syngnathus scovelli TaxID=161590 RepID=UPI0021106DE5|nr:oligodendrocyte-myelin glycoprotein [Syngnathus scovelli]